MKLLIYGGSFDPPHYGHIQLLKSAVDCVKPDKVIIMVSGTPPHKEGNMASADMRLSMCECFRPYFPDIEISDLEIRRKDISYTYKTLEQLNGIYPKADLYICVGGDMLLGFEKWKNWQQILKQAVLVVHSRIHHQQNKLEQAAKRLEAYGGRVIIAPGPVEEMSSSYLREKISLGEDPEKLLPPPAGKIAVENKLYTVQ